MVILYLMLQVATVPYFTEAVIIAIITLIGGLLTAYFKQRSDEKSKKIETQQVFINSILERVDDLETKYDALTGRMADTMSAADKRVEDVRKEMRQMIDQANFEIATWRDKYWKLIDDYQKLKLEYTALSMKFEQLEKEYLQLKSIYEASQGS